MPRRKDLHGSAPDQSPLAVLVIDVINDLEFDEGMALLRQARPMAEALSRLLARARRDGVPVIYANDNFGRWRSDFRQQVQHCLRDGVRGEEIARLLHPEEQDYFVLKPKISAFFATTLDLLLRHLGVHTLVIAGMAADSCVLFTAADAHMRDYDVIVPSDCVASNSAAQTLEALALMERMLSVRVRVSARVRMPKVSRS